jgi:hypothetical protein
MTKQFHAFVGINMIWTKLSEYCIKSGDWTIAKYHLGDKIKYGLYRLNDLKGFYSTADEAKAQANDK